MKIHFLCTGNGGCLKFIHSYLCNNNYEVTCNSNNAVLEYTKKNNIRTTYHDFTSSIENDEILLSILKKSRPDFIITTINRIISPKIVNEFKDKLINIHPSILPAFKGVGALEKAIQNNNPFAGATCHYVNEIVDSGPIITQGVFCLKNNENPVQKMFECCSLVLLSGLVNQMSNYSKNSLLVHEFIEGIWISPSNEIIDEDKARKIFEKLI